MHAGIPSIRWQLDNLYDYVNSYRNKSSFSSIFSASVVHVIPAFTIEQWVTLGKRYSALSKLRMQQNKTGLFAAT